MKKADDWEQQYNELYPRTKVLRDGARKFAEKHYNKKPSNKEFMADKSFQLACSNAGVTPSIRQASKFRSKKGIAFRDRKKGTVAERLEDAK